MPTAVERRWRGISCWLTTGIRGQVCGLAMLCLRGAPRHDAGSEAPGSGGAGNAPASHGTKLKPAAPIQANDSLVARKGIFWRTRSLTPSSAVPSPRGSPAPQVTVLATRSSIPEPLPIWVVTAYRIAKLPAPCSQPLGGGLRDSAEYRSYRITRESTL